MDLTLEINNLQELTLDLLKFNFGKIRYIFYLNVI